MGLTSEIQNRYRCGSATGAASFTLFHRKAAQPANRPQIDMRSLSGELLRVTKPPLITEFRRSAAVVDAAHKKTAAALQKSMDSESAKKSEALGLTFARYSKRMEAYGENLLNNLARGQELILAGAMSKPKRDAESNSRILPRTELPASLKDVEVILEKKLGETGEEILGGARRIARAEAEAVFRRFREDEEYEKLRVLGQ